VAPEAPIFCAYQNRASSGCSQLGQQERSALKTEDVQAQTRPIGARFETIGSHNDVLQAIINPYVSGEVIKERRKICLF
jgi:hypothetical protein